MAQVTHSSDGEGKYYDLDLLFLLTLCAFVFVASSLGATFESITWFHPHISPPSILKFLVYEYFVGNVSRMGEQLMKRNVVKESRKSSLLRCPMLRYGIVLKWMVR